MAWSMRNSKFRHVFGKALKREQCYDNIRITRSSWDAPYCAVNPKFVAIVTEAAGGGAFLVLPLSKVGRIERDCPLVAGHRDSVLDIAWCPHDDNLIASSSEDCTIKIWEIPEDGLKENLTEPMIDLEGHTKRVGHIVWHPTAQHVLLSAGCDNYIYIWDVGTGTSMVEIQTNDQPFCASFNYDGSKFAMTCKDKKLYVYDSHTGKVLKEGDTHKGAKQSRCVYLKNGLIFTTGFSKMSDRRYSLYNEKDLTKPIEEQDIDRTNGVIFPFYDPDVNMVYLCGKGDSSIRYYEIGELNDEPHVFYLEMFQSKEPQKGFGFMPKRALNVNSCEIARIYKLLNNGLCEVIPFTVPRKSDLFQEDLYPDTVGDTPAITADEFFSGKNADPLLVSLKEGFVSTRKEVGKAKKNVFEKKKPVGGSTPAASNRSSTGAPNANNNEAAAATPSLPPQLPKKTVDVTKSGFDADKLVNDVKLLQDKVTRQERRIKELEQRLDTLESQHTDEEDVQDERGDQC